MILFITHATWADQQWTWYYQSSLPRQVASDAYRKKCVVSKKNVAPFTQLLFSWNALRPAQGHYTFYGKLRDQKTKQWYDWHKMADWGSDMQVTHCSVHKKKTSYNYVRLEAPNGRSVDGFKIKVEAHGGASLKDISALNVALADLSKFEIEKVGDIKKLPAVYIRNIPQFSQMVIDSPDANRICSPTSLAMVISYFTNDTHDPLICAQHTYDPGLDTYGSWPFNVAHAYEGCGGERSFSVRRLKNFRQLHHYLRHQTPVIVSIRGALAGMPEGLTYNQGHLLVVVGWDPVKQEVIVHDPAFPTNEQVRHRYPLVDFIRAWERSRRLAYVSEPAMCLIN